MYEITKRLIRSAPGQSILELLGERFKVRVDTRIWSGATCSSSEHGCTDVPHWQAAGTHATLGLPSNPSLPDGIKPPELCTVLCS